MTRRWRMYSPGNVTASPLTLNWTSLKVEMISEGILVYIDKSWLFSTHF